MAWGRKTGGRKKGTPNKRVSVLAARAEAAVAVADGEETPIDYMLRIMRDPTVEPARCNGQSRCAIPAPAAPGSCPQAFECRWNANRAHGDCHDNAAAVQSETKKFQRGTCVLLGHRNCKTSHGYLP